MKILPRDAFVMALQTMLQTQTLFLSSDVFQEKWAFHVMWSNVGGVVVLNTMLDFQIVKAVFM